MGETYGRVIALRRLETIRKIGLISPLAALGRRRLYGAARAVWRRAQLYRLLDSASRLPAPIGPALVRARLRVKLWAGEDALVPEQELREAYTRALSNLLARKPPEALGDYLEFGVYTGTSLACMHEASSALGLSSMRLLGFDSFEGLPEIAAEDDDGRWQPGSYRSDLDLTRAALTKRGVDWSRIELVPGWYDDTLVDETADRLDLRCASVIMVDCDSYSSAKRALTFCEPLIQDESVVFFDDWNTRALADKNLGEKRAFDELLADHPDLHAVPLESYAPTAAVFHVMRRALPVSDVNPYGTAETDLRDTSDAVRPGVGATA